MTGITDVDVTPYLKGGCGLVQKRRRERKKAP